MNYFHFFCREWDRRKAAYWHLISRRDCPLCQSTERTYFCTSQDGYEFATCNGCGLLYATEFFPMSFWNDVYHRIPEIADAEQARFREQSTSAAVSTADRDRFSDYFDRVEPLSGSLAGKRYLDIGTFYGAALDIAKEYGMTAYGVEGKREIADHAAQQHQDAVLHQLSEHLSVPVFGGDFDLISAFEVLEHTPDPLESLRRIHANLSETGLVIVSVPNADNLELQMLREHCPHLLGGGVITGHVNWFCPRTLAKAFADTGFELLDQFSQFSSSILNLYLQGCGQTQNIPNYAAIVRGETSSPSLSDEGQNFINGFGPQLAAWEDQYSRGPILCAIARKAR